MKRMRVRARACALVAVTGSISLAACDSPTAMSVARDVASSLAITINGSASQEAQLVLEVGDTITLSAVATNPLGLAVPAAPVLWSSSDESVVLVDAAGLVSAVGVGSAEIRAAVGEALTSLPTVVNDSAAF